MLLVISSIIQSALTLKSPFEKHSLYITWLPWWLRCKESVCNAGDPGQVLDQEDPLEKGMTTHSGILAWRIPWTEKPGGLYSPWGHKESDTTERLTFTSLYIIRNKLTQTLSQAFDFMYHL